MISLTQKAADQILDIAVEEELESKCLRIKILGGGCAGFTHDLFFDEHDPLPLDEVFEDKGVTLIVDPLSYQYLDGAELDFVESLYGSGFKFNNPNFSSTCGCGKSYGV
jgi:iron-sulfur cluster insertion protein